MFNSCKKLEKILLVNHNSDCNFEYMFLECPNIIAKDFCEKNNLNSFLPKMIIMNKNAPSDKKINEESKSIRHTNSNKLFERLKNTFNNMIIKLRNNICSNIVKIRPLFKRKKLKTVEYDDKGSETSEEELISNNNSWAKCNKVYLLIKVNEKDVNKKVFFLSNNEFKSDENENSIYNNDNLKVLNDSNTQLYIDEEKQENFKRYFIPKKKGLYKILLKFNISLTDCSYMFARCENILKINFKDFNTEKVINMEYMFFGCKNMEYVNMLSFNTKKVTNMSGMFYDCNSLEDLNLSSFETKNVTNMSKMFYNCYHLNSIDLNSFNTINVINMSYMFYFCCNLNSLNLSHFNTNKVSDLSHMFDSCSKLKKLSLFNYCINKVKNSYNTTKIINCEGKFLNCSNLESIDYFEINDKNSSIYENSDKSNTTYLKSDTSIQNENDTDISKTSPNNFSAINKNSSYIGRNKKNSENIPLINMSYMFSGCHRLKNLFLFDFNKFDVYDERYMFDNCNNLGKNNNCNHLIIYVGVNEKEVNDNKKIYILCNDILKYNNDNLNQLNDSNTKLYINDKKQDFNRYFIPKKSGVFKVELIFNINLTDCSYMFAGCENILLINFVSFNTENVLNMKYMFSGCKNLKRVNFDPFNTKNATDMSGMFYECNLLNDLNLNTPFFNTEKVTDMSNMFYNCKNLERLNINSLKTHNVIDMNYDMNYMFSGCNKLINLKYFNRKGDFQLSDSTLSTKNETKNNESAINAFNIVGDSGIEIDACFGCESRNNIYEDDTSNISSISNLNFSNGSGSNSFYNDINNFNQVTNNYI